MKGVKDHGSCNVSGNMAIHKLVMYDFVQPVATSVDDTRRTIPRLTEILKGQ
jgi:hypothetical protein